MKCSAFIAASIDAFIARLDGDTSWLHNPEYAVEDGGDFGYSAFMETVDVLVMGRVTFETVLSFPEWPYAERRVVVLSRQGLAIPKHLHDKVRVENLAPDALVSQLERGGARHLYVDGGQTIQGFLKAGLLDEITITWIPIILGGGIPLFGSIGAELPLRHRQTRSFGNGFVQSTYDVVYITSNPPGR
jgi:dihydrofolate reductase